jgi:plasmid stabilization system protein ParE
MNLRIRLRPEAESDLLEAYQWYERQRAGLGDRFLEAVEEIFVRIQADPEFYVAAVRNVRRGKVRTFPYVVYYRALADWVEVIAVLHGSRDPRIWQSRS